MKHLFTSLMIVSVATLWASVAHADKCGTKDRVQLPACVDVKRASVMGGKGSLTVVNKCSYLLTVKFDKPGNDVRRDIAPGSQTTVETDPYATKLSCCPRYSQCTTPPPPPAPPAPPPAGRQNLALGKPASQSSTTHNGSAARAVDGNTDGKFTANSVTHTDTTAQAWWQVDLGAIRKIGEVVLFNRTDCCNDRLSNFEIKVSNDGATWTKVAELAGTAPPQSSHVMNATGRYVRVQLRGTNNLSLAEVQVFETASPAFAGLPCNSKVMLRSSKGDYLHRPDDARPIVTTWDTRQPWTIERNAGFVRLKSWKNDHLERASTPQGVQTGSVDIDWTLEAVP